MTDYEIRALQGKNYKVKWQPEDLTGMREIKRLSKVTRRLEKNWQDNHNRITQLAHLDKEGENSPTRNLMANIRDSIRIDSQISAGLKSHRKSILDSKAV